MDDLFEPIEIEIALNGPEALRQADALNKGLGDLDAAIGKTEKSFHSFLAQKVKEQGIDIKTLQLKEREIQQLEKYTISIKNLKSLMELATDPTQIDVYKFKVDELQQKINGLLSKKGNPQILPDIEKQGASIGKTKRQWDGLGNSINQITRELPAFTYSAQTGFMAISNNIPILADEILRLRMQNQELIKSGEKGIPVWKQVLKSFTSWQTLMSLGVTLLTIYGKEIVEFVSKLFTGEKTIDSFKRRIESLNKAFESSKFSKAIEDVLKMKAAFKSAEKGVLSKEAVLRKYNEGLGKVLGSTNDINIAEKTLRDKSDAYIKAMLLRESVTIAASEASKKLAKNQLELSNLNVRKDEVNKALESSGPVQYSVTTGAAYGQTYTLNKELETINKKIQEKTSLEGQLIKEGVEVVASTQKALEKLLSEFSLDFNKNDAKTVNSRKQLLQKLSDLDQEYARKNLSKDAEEIQALKDKFAKVRKLVQEFNADPKNKTKTISLDGINALEESSTDTLKYRQDTKKLSEQLDQEKQLFAAYEAFKSQTSEDEANKRFNKLLGGYKNYGERLKESYTKLQEELNQKPKEQITGAEQERLIALQERLDAYKKNQNKTAEQRFIDAYNSTISHKEQLLFIEQDFAARELELNKINDKKLRAQKLAELKLQKQIVIDNTNSEAYERTQIFEQLSADLLGITKRELANRIASLEEYLQLSKGSLTEEQRAFVESELKKAKAIQSVTDLGIREKALLQEKAAIKKRISEIDNKSLLNVADESGALAEINAQLRDIFAKKLEKLASIASKYSAIFANAAADLKDVDQGLSDTLETMSELANVAASAITSIASFSTGDIVGGITSAISAIGGLFSLGAKARESERKAREEIKKWQQEQFDAQLEYNAEFRKRLLDEVKLNDLYQSRVANIKEQLAVNKKNAAEVLKDQQAIFQRLLQMQVTVGKTTEKYGGFLGFWQKTRVVDIKKSIKDLLGYTGELTDDIFDQLQKLNRDHPLTGDAKEAYEALKKLRDEYGSIDEAIKELHKQLVDTITGTTAQSLADSIKQGIESGKRTFADFAEDIEGFLRQAILAGMSAKILEPQMQKLQDLLYGFLGDDILTADEKKQFQEMYLKIAKEAREYMDLINQTGIGIGNEINTSNSLKGAVQGITATQADLLSGQFGGMRLAQLDNVRINKAGFAGMLEQTSKQVEIMIKVEQNTRRTAENTDKLNTIDETLIAIKKNTEPDKSTKGNGF